MRRMLVRVPLFCSVLLAGGCEAQLCNLLGQFVGSFEGDLAGDVSAVISIDPEDDEVAIADMELNTGTETLGGQAPVQCADGELTIDLSSEELGVDIGEVTGTLGDGEASGLWSLFATDESGTWEY